MKSISNFNFSGKKVLLRVDFNVPQDSKFRVTDSTRILATKPTIDKILGDGGAVILMTHLGRPKGKVLESLSLKNIVSEVSRVLQREVKFCFDCVGEEVLEMSRNLKTGELLLLENLRFHKEEEEGEEGFARKLSELGDVYVNDAFGTAHRNHASTSVIAKFFPSNKFFGFLISSELEVIDRLLNKGERPITVVIGGAKVSSKIGIIENFINIANSFIIGGAMAFTFIKAKGGKVGRSLVENDKLELALSILEKAESVGVKIHLPVDVVAAYEFSNNSETKVCDIFQIPDEMMGLDVGKKSSSLFNDVILDSRTILWNGPLGAFEMEKFSKGTVMLGESIAEATSQGAFSLVGGGDSVAFVKQFHYDTKVSYVSTGGGAMLESLEGKELPGIAAINS